MGFPKQLAEYKGSTILETTIETVSTYFEEAVVVLGHDSETIMEKVDFKSSAILINENWQEGIISSIVVPIFSPPLLDFSLEHEVVNKRISVIKRNMIKF